MKSSKMPDYQHNVPCMSYTYMPHLGSQLYSSRWFFSLVYRTKKRSRTVHRLPVDCCPSIVLDSTLQYYTVIYRKEGECLCDVTSGPLGKGELERTNTGTQGKFTFSQENLHFILYYRLSILQHYSIFWDACLALHVLFCIFNAANCMLLMLSCIAGAVSCVLNILFCIMCASRNVLHIWAQHFILHILFCMICAE